MNRLEAAALPEHERRLDRGRRFVFRMYLPRVVGNALGGVAVASVLLFRDTPLALWLAFFASVLLWPHAALWLGQRSRNPYRAELRNLMADSALGGVWIAWMHFNLLPSLALLIMLSMDKLAVGGVRFLARCTGLLVLSCLAAAAVADFAFEPHTNMVQIVGSLPLLAAYPAVVGLTAYRLARRVREQNQLLQEMSRTDGLSGLLNRRYWEEAVAEEFRRSRQMGATASLLMLDIDHFKAINDRHGHPVGDEVIRRIASILRQCLRDEDVPGRYGGEEFGVVLPGTGAEGAELIAERIRKRLENATLAAGVRATVSIGVAALDRQDGDYGAWIAHADRALYAAKERGRNRSVRFQAAAAPHAA